MDKAVDDILLDKMQAESRMRHPIEQFGKRPYKRRKPYKNRQPKVILPDLMAEMIANDPKKPPTDAPQPCQEAIIENTVQESTPEVSPEFRQFYAPKKKKEILRMSHPIQKPCHVPNPVGRNITRTPMLPDYSKKQSFVRPPAQYNNISSPYGLWTEMAADQLKRSG